MDTVHAAQQLEQIAQDMDPIARFVGAQDIEELTAAANERVLGIPQVDVLVLFGGAILAGADQFAQAMRNGVATTYVIDGGVGHTTLAFRQSVRNLPQRRRSSRPIWSTSVGSTLICLRRNPPTVATTSPACGTCWQPYKVSCQSMILMGVETMQ